MAAPGPSWRTQTEACLTWAFPMQKALVINDAGRVAGEYFTPEGRRHAFVWENGTATDLGTLGGRNSFVKQMNKGGARSLARQVWQRPTDKRSASTPSDGMAQHWRPITLGGSFSRANVLNEAARWLVWHKQQTTRITPSCWTALP
jgi:probable HAF family extracellular repeat protein